MIADESLFEIKDLVCSYDFEHPVLKVPDLTIYRNKLTMLLGTSGSGKSTLLETLGLMNHTLSQGDVRKQPEDVSYRDLWEEKDPTARSKFRMKRMSFVFQENNLMHNFNVIENAVFPQLIQNIPMSSAVVEVRKWMKELWLDDVAEDKSVIGLSVGQRQRLAFVKGITPNFEIFFGDEPTGNLDEFNSHALMGKLRKFLYVNNKSAIIVTHDIDLALKYADEIIILTKELSDDKAAQPIGVVEDGHILTFPSKKVDRQNENATNNIKFWEKRVIDLIKNDQENKKEFLSTSGKKTDVRTFLCEQLVPEELNTSVDG